MTSARQILLLLALFFGVSGAAHAVTQYEAHVQCTISADNREAQPDWQVPANGFSWVERCVVHPYIAGVQAPYYGLNWCSNGGCANASYSFDANLAYPESGYVCPAPNTIQEDNSCIEEQNECEAKPPLFGAIADTVPSGNVCIEGCSYYQSAGVGGTGPDGNYNRSGKWESSGQDCTGDPANFEPTGTGSGGEGGNAEADSCIPTGALTQCYNPASGKQCAVTPRGNKACWTPGESGPKISQDQKEGLDKQPANNAPPTPPTSLNQASAEQTTSTSQSAPGATPSTSTSTTYYYNVTGVAGTGTNGSTSGGTATGSNPGGGTAPGEGSEDGEEGGSAGAPGEGVGDGLYEGNGEKTLETVFTTYKASVEAAPIVQAVGGFFEVEVPGGACPTMEVGPIEPYLPLLQFSAHCAGLLATALYAAGFIILAGALLVAFRIAIL